MDLQTTKMELIDWIIKIKDVRIINSIKSIKDHEIFNLAVRHGRSNAHHGVGYLIHPTAIGAIADWIDRGTETAADV